MEDVRTVGLIIQPIEQRHVVSFVVESGELRGVQEPSAPYAIDVKEISKFRISKPECNIAANAAVRPVGGVHISKKSSRAESRPSGDLSNQAGLIAKFGARRACSRLHALNGTNRNLGGEQLALLIADRLAVDQKTHLCVIAKRMKKSVPVGGNSTSAINDRFTQACSGIEGRELQHQTSIDVDVSRGIVLYNRTPGRFYRHTFPRSSNCQRWFDLNRNRVPDVDLLRVCAKARSIHLQLVGVWRNIAQTE